MMASAYGWAFVKPIRKLYYNMTITFVSVIVALLVGGIEALGLIGDRLHATGGFWSGIAALNRNFGSIGYLIIAVFIAKLDARRGDLPAQAVRCARGGRDGSSVERRIRAQYSGSAGVRER